MNPMNASRREFLRAAGALTAAAAGPAGQRFSAPFALSLAGIGALAAGSTQAANTSTGYRALVCLFMQGGNDSHNWVVPVDGTSYAQYAAVRRELAWPAANLQPITSTSQGTGRSFGMPAELQPLRGWYESGQAAIVANVGPLERPVTVAEFTAGVGLPEKLFSHNDQASTWQSLSPEGARSGWGGRMGDILMSANANPVFTAISASGNAVFLSGSSITQYQVDTAGPVSVRVLGESMPFGSTTAAAVVRRTIVAAGSTPMQAEYARVVQRSMDSSEKLRAALAGVSVPAVPITPISATNTATLAQDSLAKQLRMVAQLIGAGQALGMRRQVFMVSIGGFDTHNNQMRDQPLLMSRVAASANYFLSALNTMGQLNNVTLFTASDFGRTLTSNGNGSDHGWGSHHFVAGGAVKGRNIYGRFPVTTLGTADDVGSGRLLPTTSVTEYAAEMARWMGLSATEQAMVLPNLGNFSGGASGLLGA